MKSREPVRISARIGFVACLIAACSGEAGDDAMSFRSQDLGGGTDDDDGTGSGTDDDGTMPADVGGTQCTVLEYHAEDDPEYNPEDQYEMVWECDGEGAGYDSGDDASGFQAIDGTIGGTCQWVLRKVAAPVTCLAAEVACNGEALCEIMDPKDFIWARRNCCYDYVECLGLHDDVRSTIGTNDPWMLACGLRAAGLGPPAFPSGPA
ncbi:MAG: hypothetical protein IPH07_12400 [Deltaproteobacteria bacterium]|nr:hypothetical protein [Deltaproteobacteria bacterium]MBK8717124.1 hypothetical protein [Deltaproteobacteria bacterium]MBP7286353.1 hypothetical protein [Nannocystaceae bacterium]